LKTRWNMSVPLKGFKGNYGRNGSITLFWVPGSHSTRHPVVPLRGGVRAPGDSTCLVAVM